MRMAGYWVPVVFVAITACGSDNGSDDGSDDGSGNGTLSSGCSSNDDCEEGLICAQGSDLKGLCTCACELNSDCRTKFGDATQCWDGYCTKECDTIADCEVGHCAVWAGGHDFCAGDPAPLSETCLTDSDCESGLSCPTEGELQGLCTKACSAEPDCTSYSASASCDPSLNLCVRGCYEDDECQENGYCLHYSDWDGYCRM